MPIEPIKIPQNVYVEDRIIGPITLKQLIIIGIGAGFSYILYATASKGGPVSLPYTVALWSPSLVAAAFAFLKINDLSLFNIILLSIEHMNKPNTRTWAMHPGISINIVTKPPSHSEKTEVKAKDSTIVHLAEMTTQLERQQKELAKLVGAMGASQTSQVAQAQNTPVAEKAPSPAPAVEDVVQETTKEEMPEGPIQATSTPVDPNRIAVSGLDPTRSVDGLSDLSAFKHIFKPS